MFRIFYAEQVKDPDKMTLTLLTALFAFAIVTTATPGPNNLMVMASGANFGYRGTIPHMLGIQSGVCFMIAVVGMGAWAVFETFPALDVILKVLAFAYMLYLAWKIANAGAPKSVSAGAKPMTYLQAAAFQWVNPKAWAMALSAITLYAPDRSWTGIALIILAFALVSFPANSMWVWLGTVVGKALADERKRKLFNWTMAGLLIASLAPVLVLG